MILIDPDHATWESRHEGLEPGQKAWGQALGELGSWTQFMKSQPSHWQLTTLIVAEYHPQEWSRVY